MQAPSLPKLRARVRFSSPVPYETPGPKARGVCVVQAGGQVSHHNRADRWLPSRADGLSESSIAGKWCDYWPTGRRRHRQLRHDDPKHGRGTGVGVGRLRDVDTGARIASRSVAAREARPPLLNPRKREPFLHKKARGRASPESEKSSTQSVPRRASASTSTGVVRWFATHHKRSDEGPEVFFSNKLASYPPAGAGGGAAEHRHGVRVRSQQHRLPQVLLDDQRLTPSL